MPTAPRSSFSATELAASVVEVLQNPSVRASLLEALIKPAVESAVREAVAANNEEMARLIAQQSEQQVRIDGLEAQVKQLSAVVTEQAIHLNELDQYGRKSCVVVSGIPEQAAEMECCFVTQDCRISTQDFIFLK